MENQRVLSYFDEILKIPRPSYHEAAIADYLERFGTQRWLSVMRDSCNNVILKKVGNIQRPAVVLQSHSDMVWVTEQPVPPGNEIPNEVYIEDGIMRTKGTTLGADDGIGIAMILAILDEDDPDFPPIEAVFTANEEETMEGAMALQPSCLEGTCLINLDSEEEGVLTIGAAGGISSECIFPIHKRSSAFQHAVRIQVTGGKGGHSGLEIREKRENAIQLLVRVLRSLPQTGWELAKIEGGERSNAIPIDAAACINTDRPQDIRQAVAAFTAQRCSEWRNDEPELNIRVEAVSSAEQVYEAENAECICLLLENLPHGPRSQTKEFVCSSVNLALLWETEEELHVELSLRSSFASWYHDEVERIAHFTRFLGGSTIAKDEYAAWQYQVDSHLLSATQETYRQLFGKEALCENVHAGVECGIIMEQCPSIREAISFGPTIRNAHTIREELDVDSVGTVYCLLRETLHRLNSL